MSLREIIGGDKIITKNRLQVELHNFYTRILPYLSKAVSTPISATINTYQLTSDGETIVEGTTAELKELLTTWVNNRFLTFEVEATTMYEQDGVSYLGRTWSDLQLSNHQKQLLKSFITREFITDYETQVFVNNSSNNDMFNYIGLKFIEIRLSSNDENNGYIKVGLDNTQIPEGLVVDFNVVGSN